MRSAGHLIVDQLAQEGIERVYSVPGESFLDVLDGLYGSSINNVVCRQEGGAGFMALAEGRLTGKPGVAMVTRGPGAANFFIAAHCAYQDATPLVCFVGLVPYPDRRRESFQEFSIDNWFDSTVKRVYTVEDADQAAAVTSEAIHTALSGRPGPVVVGLPEDLLRQKTNSPTLTPRAIAQPHPSNTDLDEFKERLTKAECPLVVVGGDHFFGTTGQILADWAYKNNIPVASDWRNYDAVPNNHPAYVGWLGYGRRDSLVEAMKNSDLFIGVGAVRNDVMSEGYTVGLDTETILIGTDFEVPQHAGRIDQFIASTPANFVASLDKIDEVQGNRSDHSLSELRSTHEKFSSSGLRKEELPSISLDLVFDSLNQQLPKERVVTYGAGNATIWGHRQLTHNVPNSLVASRNGAMGLATPAAVASSLIFPQRQSIAICGDGDFMMNGQEIATLVAQESKALFVVVDNGKFATIVEHQERQYPGRPSGTSMSNPDFVSWFESYGGKAIRINTNDEIQSCIGDLLNHNGPALLHLVIDPNTPSPQGAGF